MGEQAVPVNRLNTSSATIPSKERLQYNVCVHFPITITLCSEGGGGCVGEVEG